MSHYKSFSDDFYVNMHLNTEMDLPQSRETLLHCFEQVQKKYPTLRNLTSRDRGETILEEDKESGSYRWVSLETRRVCSGSVNPESDRDALEQHHLLLDITPYSLSLSPLDCESLNLMYGFDFTYRGNHNQLLVDVLGLASPLEKLMDLPGAKLVNHEPSVTIALDEDCRYQCRLGFEPRTSLFHLRTGDYPEEQLSVYLYARHFGSLEPGQTYSEVLSKLDELCREVLDTLVIEQVLQPLQQAIAIK